MSLSKSDEQIKPNESSTHTPGVQNRIGRHRQRKKQRSKETLRRSGSEDTLKELNYIQTPNDDADTGYRSDTSDPGDDLEEILMSSSLKEKPDSDHPVNRIKRSFSGKFRGASHKISSSSDSQGLPVDETIHKLIRQGATPKQVSKSLKRASHIDQLDSKRQSALHLCAARGLVDLVKLLIRKGSNVNLQDSDGYTPLHCAALEKQLESCQLLLETKGVDVSITTKENANVLHYLARIPVDDDNVVLYRRVLDLVIERGLDMNLGNMYQEAPIHFACMKGNTHNVAFLLERGADVNLRTKLGETPLHYAARSGSVKLVRVLMENGADPTAKGEYLATPVDVAAQYQHDDIIDCFRSIIEEELVIELNSSLISSRVRLNESTVIHEGWMEVFFQDDWKHLWIVVNNHRIVCYSDQNKSSQTIVSGRLARCTLAMEEGSVFSESGEQLWCFTLLEEDPDSPTTGGSPLTFATLTPTERDEWIEAIETIIEKRNQLYDIFKKLQEQTNPRERLRLRERKLAHAHLMKGINSLKNLLTCDPQQSPPMKNTLLNWINTDTESAAAVLSESINIEDENFLRAFVKFLLHTGNFLAFVKASISYEIRKTVMGETLFREMSISTRMLSYYLDMEDGREYLKNTVLSLETSIMSQQDCTLELNPNLSNSISQIRVKASTEKIIEFSQSFLDRVLSSPNLCPPTFRKILRHTREKVDLLFPNMSHAVVGGFVFLRFFCPAIVSPEKYGITKQRLEPKFMRVCVLITKLLQSVSNGVEFDGTKEDYMQRLNPFIKRNRLYVNVFFDNLTDPELIEKQSTTPLVSKKVPSEEISKSKQIIVQVLSGLSEKLDKLMNTPEPDCGSEEDIDILEELPKHDSEN